MVYSLVVRASGLGYGGREFESRSLHLKPETKFREERGFLVVERVLRPYCWALNPQKQQKNNNSMHRTWAKDDRRHISLLYSISSDLFQFRWNHFKDSTDFPENESLNYILSFILFIPEQNNMEQGPSGTSSSQDYEAIYFDSDEEEGESKSSRRKKINDDDLFYDPQMDEDDQEYVDQMRRKYHSLHGLGNFGKNLF